MGEKEKNFKDKYKVGNQGDKPNKPGRKLNKGRAATLAAILTATGITTGAMGSRAIEIINEGKNYKPDITRMEKISNEKSNLEKLGIDKKTVDEMIKINKKLSDEKIKNSDLIKLSANINSLQFDIIREKLGKALDVDENEIKVWVHNEPNGKQFCTADIDKKTYTEESIFKGEQTIDDNISNFIKEIDSMQTLMKDLQKGNFNRETVIKKYKDAMEKAEKVALSSRITVDKNENISMEEVQLVSNKAKTGKVETKNATYTVKTADDDFER